MERDTAIVVDDGRGSAIVRRLASQDAVRPR
jgi:hypothetical protein